MNDANQKQLVQGNTAFACALYASLKGAAGNLFFSPYSVSAALAMTYAGARGETASQMTQALEFPFGQGQLHETFATLQAGLNGVQAKGAVQLNVANSLWPQAGYALREAFLALLKDNYAAAITPLNFADGETARRTINAWVEDKTNDKIKDLLKPGNLSPLTKLVLVNAIYFKGDWAWQFDERRTKEADFWLATGTSVKTPLMTQKRSFNYGQQDNLQILELPYEAHDLSMIIFLPKALDGLPEIESALTAENLADWTANLRRREVQVFLPRLLINARFILNSALGSLGMVDAFAAGKADFSGMDGQEKNLYIGLVVHQAFVEVNEEGTEAAAATAVVMRTLSISAPPPVFRADHPFLFLIRDNNSGSILFIGRVSNPMA